MIEVRKYNALGNHVYGWLNAHYHFSFAGYYDPERLGVGPLIVINDDIIKPHSGFETHAHNNMEIITYVRKGAITHKDSMGHEGRTEAGDVQVMSAGTGVQHSEHNREDTETNLYQIWLKPNKLGVKPRWEQRKFPKAYSKASLPLLVSGLPEHKNSDALFIYADGAIYGGVIKEGDVLSHTVKSAGYLLVSYGKIRINGIEMAKGDGAVISKEETLTIGAEAESEVLLIEVEKR